MPPARGEGARPRKRCRPNSPDDSKKCKFPQSLHNLNAVCPNSNVGSKVQFLFVVIEATLNDDPDKGGEPPRANRWGTFRPPATWRGFGDELFGVAHRDPCNSSFLSSASSSSFSSSASPAVHSSNRSLRGRVFRYVNGTVTEAVSARGPYQYTWERENRRGGRGRIIRSDFSTNNPNDIREDVCPEYSTRTVFDCGPRNPVVVAEGDASAISPKGDKSSTSMVQIYTSDSPSSSSDEDNTSPNQLGRRHRRRHKETKYLPIYFHMPSPHPSSPMLSAHLSQSPMPIRIAHPHDTTHHIAYHRHYASHPRLGVNHPIYDPLPPVPPLPPSFPILSRQMPPSASPSYFTGQGGPIPWIFEPSPGAGSSGGGSAGLAGDLGIILGMLALTAQKGQVDEAFLGGRWRDGTWTKLEGVEGARPVIQQNEGRGVIVHVALEPGHEMEIAQARKELEEWERNGVILRER